MSKTPHNKLWTGNYILACISYFLIAFSFYLLMPALPLFLADVLKIPESNVGMVMSSYTLAMLVTRPFSGWLVDNMSRRTLLLISIFLFSMLFGPYMFAATVAAFILVRSAQGVLWGISTVASNTLTIDIIPASKRARGIGYYGLNLNLAMSVAPWAGIEIYKSFGYNTLIIICIASSMLSLLFAFFIKVDEKPVGVKNKEPLSLDRFVLVPALPLMFNLLLCSVPYGMLIAYGIIYGEKNNVSNPGFLFLFLAIGIGLSRIISGKFVDKGYKHIVSLLSLILLSVAFFWFGMVKTTFAYCGGALLAGLSLGCIITVFQTLFINMAKHNRRGTANSTYLISFDLGISMGMLAGGVISQYKNLSAAYIFGAILCVIAIPYYKFITEKVYEKNKLYD